MAANYEVIKQAMAELDDEKLLSLAQEIMDEGGKDAQLCLQACQEGMKEVGDLFSEGEYFVGDLVFAGELMTQALGIIKPALSGEGEASIGTMILCTVKKDLHDIGKNIVKAMLEAAGINVVDLGIDVDPEEIVKTAKADGIRVIGLSGVLTLALDSMKDTVDAFKAAGLREDVRIIVGGNPVTEEGCQTIGADAWAILPQDTVRTCSEWLKAN